MEAPICPAMRTGFSLKADFGGFVCPTGTVFLLTDFSFQRLKVGWGRWSKWRLYDRLHRIENSTKVLVGFLQLGVSIGLVL